jgi:filamentous hemagglutinin
MATAKVAGKDPAAAMDAAQIAVVNNYLSHVQASALENAKERRQQCTTKACADEADQEIKTWQLLDKKNNQTLAAACANLASEACKTATADVNAAAASYVGKKDGWDSFGVVGQERSEATTLANQYNSKQWCSSNSVGCAIAIASPLFPALAATAPALLGEAIGACTLNPLGCTETINALADGLLADGAVGFVGVSAAKTAVEKATVTALEKTGASVVGNSGGKVLGELTGTPTRIPAAADASEIRSLTRENQSAEILANGGFKVEQNPTVTGPKNPDYRINGEVFDNYAPASSSVRNIASNIEEKVIAGQTNNVVVNLADSSTTLAALQAQLTNYPVSGLKQVIIIDKSGSFTVIKF